MAKYHYDDRVKISASADLVGRAGTIAWVIGVFEVRPKGEYFQQFPPGVIYAVEFEDGEAIDVHESLLELEE